MSRDVDRWNGVNMLCCVKTKRRYNKRNGTILVVGKKKIVNNQRYLKITIPMKQNDSKSASLMWPLHPQQQNTPSQIKQLDFFSSSVNWCGGHQWWQTAAIPAPDVIDTSLLWDCCSVQPAKSAEKVSASQLKLTVALTYKSVGQLDGSMMCCPLLDWNIFCLSFNGSLI